jgi:hypothetical protein
MLALFFQKRCAPCGATLTTTAAGADSGLVEWEQCDCPQSHDGFFPLRGCAVLHLKSFMIHERGARQQSSSFGSRPMLTGATRTHNSCEYDANGCWTKIASLGQNCSVKVQLPSPRDKHHDQTLGMSAIDRYVLRQRYRYLRRGAAMCFLRHALSSTSVRPCLTATLTCLRARRCLGGGGGVQRRVQQHMQLVRGLPRMATTKHAPFAF